VLGAISRDCGAPVIAPDVEGAARILVDRFAALGHRRIACIGPHGGYQFVAAHSATLAACGAACGLTFSFHEGPASEAGGFAQTRAALSQTSPPTAFLYLFNRMAHGGVTALCESSLEPGRDVAVISFGDDHLLPHTRPPMTAMRWPVHDMSRHAVDVLTRIIGRQPLDIVPTWPVELVLRASDCRAPATDRPRPDIHTSPNLTM
jgi:DNA-binding LacI/PurR family transcriptional regulator